MLGTPCPKRAAEAGSAKDKKASSSSSSESEAGSRKRKRSSSSSSSSSSSTRKSKLRVAIPKLRADVADLAEGIVSHQELEEENERLVELTNALTEENQVRRAALQR